MAIVYLDLTDEHGQLFEDFAERNPPGTRALLAVLNLENPGWWRKQNARKQNARKQNVDEGL